MKSLILNCVAAAGLFAITSTASAQTRFDANHPRRAEVNSRLKNQNKRITNQVKDGDMSHAKAQRLRANDRATRSEERSMASQNGGHITKGEKKVLNHQENKNSRKIAN
jgi:ketol-acid reductoisomerase